MPLLLLKSKKDYSVKNMIHKELASWEPARDPKHLHASDLMKDLEFCPREYALLDLTGLKPKGQYIGTAQRITFDHGKDMENRMRNDWLRYAAVGFWKCRGCGHLSQFGKAPKSWCNTCKANLWDYTEARFSSASSGISGGVDLFLDVGDTKHRLVEIKSMDKDMFKELAAPLAEHKFRTSLYLRLVEEELANIAKFSTGSSLAGMHSGAINVNRGHLLYVSKSFGFKDTSLAEAGIKDAPFSPFKEFIIERDDKLTDISYSKAKALHVFRQDPAVGIPAGVCSSGLIKRAQKCSCVAPCFSGNYASTITWMEGGKPKHPGKKII